MPVTTEIIQDDFLQRWKEMLIGQDPAIEQIFPYVQMFQAGLSPEGRPVGVFMLLGPTGTGKTKTVETLAELIHGSPKSMVKIDCAEFQLEHEVAKLIGAPPGYLGHRETHPILTQTKLNAANSEQSNMSIVLFDEIEKAAPSMSRILLGVLDKAQLRLGDNTTVNFERSLIFMTSNLGAKEMQEYLSPGFGYEKLAIKDENRKYKHNKMEAITKVALTKRFSPEFMNRIDCNITYTPLTMENMETILRIHIEDFQTHIYNRLGPKGFIIDITEPARQWLLKKGFSDMYGARELKRVIHKQLVQPISAKICSGEIQPASTITITVNESESGFYFNDTPSASARKTRRATE